MAAMVRGGARGHVGVGCGDGGRGGGGCCGVSAAGVSCLLVGTASIRLLHWVPCNNFIVIYLLLRGAAPSSDCSS